MKLLKLINNFKPYLWRCFNSFQSSGFVHRRFRETLLRLVGCDLHKSVVIYENVYIGSTDIVFHKNVYVNVGCFFDACATIELCEGVRIGPYVRFLTGSHEYTGSVFRRDPSADILKLPIVVERGCWIGMGSMIFPGVTVKEGCIIGGGAVVVRDTEPNGLYVGNPAKRIKDLPID